MSDGDDEASPRGAPLPAAAASGASERRGQLVVPGLYAWSLTVAPLALRAGASAVTRVAVGLGLVALLASLALGGERSEVARRTALFGLTFASALAFVSAGPSAAPRDPVTGVLGMVGWGIFAVVAASPMRWSESVVGERARITLPREAPRRGWRDSLALGLATVGALVLQWPGWGVASPERAVLVRVVTLACACAFVVSVLDLESSSRSPRAARSAPARVRAAMVWLAALALVLSLGLVLAAIR